jgi:sterol carrier protein 2
MGLEAATKALLDAGLFHTYHQTFVWLIDDFTGITYDDIQTAAVGYCYGDSTSGQVRLLQIFRKS